MENKFINSKPFTILVYTIGTFVLIGSELKRLAIKQIRAYNKSNVEKI